MLYLNNIDDIIKNAILLNTETAKAGGKKKGNLVFMHHFYSLINNNGVYELLKLFVDESYDTYRNINTRRAFELKSIEKMPSAAFARMLERARATKAEPNGSVNVAWLFELVKQADKNFNPKPSSLAVNENGKPKIFYHGTLNKFDAFSKDMIGERHLADDQGFFFVSSEKLANYYAVSEFDANRKGYVMPVFLNVKNPLIVDANWANKHGMYNVFKNEDVISLWDNEDYQETIKQAANDMNADGIIVDDGNTQMAVVFESSQIKSVDNIGTFDRANENIYLQDSARGGIDLAPHSGLASTIVLSKDADASTFVHELAHWYLNEMRRISDLSQNYTAVPDQLIADLSAVSGWWGDNASDISRGARERYSSSPEIASAATEEAFKKWLAAGMETESALGSAFDRLCHEYFARGFEAYLREGKAPTSALQRVFRAFKNWLCEVYRSVAALDVSLSDDIRSVFDRMLASREAVEQFRAEMAVADARVKTVVAAEFGSVDISIKNNRSAVYKI